MNLVAIVIFQHGDHPAFARIVIEDGGTGIPSGDIVRIFDRFRTDPMAG